MIDLRSLALHRRVAEKLIQNPGLLARAKDNLVRWRRDADGRVSPCLDEWGRILDAGLEETLRILAEDSDHAAALRQSTPFSGILSPSERWNFLRLWQNRERFAPGGRK